MDRFNQRLPGSYKSVCLIFLVVLLTAKLVQTKILVHKGWNIDGKTVAHLFKFLGYESEGLEYGTGWSSDCDNSFWTRTIGYIYFCS